MNSRSILFGFSWHNSLVRYSPWGLTACTWQESMLACTTNGGVFSIDWQNNYLMSSLDSFENKWHYLFSTMFSLRLRTPNAKTTVCESKRTCALVNQREIMLWSKRLQHPECHCRTWERYLTIDETIRASGLQDDSFHSVRLRELPLTRSSSVRTNGNRPFVSTHGEADACCGTCSPLGTGLFRWFASHADNDIVTVPSKLLSRCCREENILVPYLCGHMRLRRRRLLNRRELFRLKFSLISFLTRKTKRTVKQGARVESIIRPWEFIAVLFLTASLSLFVGDSIFW